MPITAAWQVSPSPSYGAFPECVGGARECSLQALEDRAQRLEKQVQEMARDLESTRLKQQVCVYVCVGGWYVGGGLGGKWVLWEGYVEGSVSEGVGGEVGMWCIKKCLPCSLQIHYWMLSSQKTSFSKLLHQEMYVDIHPLWWLSIQWLFIDTLTCMTLLFLLWTLQDPHQNYTSPLIARFRQEVKLISHTPSPSNTRTPPSTIGCHDSNSSSLSSQLDAILDRGLNSLEQSVQTTLKHVEQIDDCHYHSNT